MVDRQNLAVPADKQRGFMTPERWQQICDVLERALELPPAERSSFLDGTCSADRELRAEIDSLLAAEKVVQSVFLRSPLSDQFVGNGDSARGSESTLPEGQVFAERFALNRKLGEGGMGQVWLAEQTSPVRRQVAVKLIRAGMYDEAVAKRFQAELQSLAIMDHPAIAKVFEAGATPQGQPYFVMEYVPGLPMTEYCDQKKLKIAARLELFIQVCEGVQHAHQKAIIHRDLKPGNILVAEVDGKPVPRIIDFGLAKAVTPRVDSETWVTQLGGLVGTPAYMSPEQADPAQYDIDTRTDVYSLGVILFVLLTGEPPLDLKHWQNQPLEMLHRLREEEPLRPSVKVSSNRENSYATANARGTEPAHLFSLLRGDLDWIAMKALEKDRARRYGSPLELAADLQRYLNHEPVFARPASTRYRLQKYIRRHRVAATLVSALVLLLASFAALQTVELRNITRERDRANRERDRATRITDFMTRMFRLSDPSHAGGNTITAREVLDGASKDIDEGLEKDPEVQSDLLEVMARTYANLGLYPEAQKLVERSLATRQTRLGPDDRKTLQSMSTLGWILDREGHVTESEQLERQALAAEERTLKKDDPLTLETMDHLAVALQGAGHYDEEEKLERKVLDASVRVLGAESEQTLRSRDNLAVSLLYQGRYTEAEHDYRQLFAVERRVWGPNHPETLLTETNFALALGELARLPEAVELLREALGIDRRVFGPDHRNTTLAVQNLGSLLVREGHFHEGETLLREALKTYTRTLGSEHAETLMAKLNLADVLFQENRLREAEKLQRETLESQTQVLGPENPDTLLSQTDLARTLVHEHGRYAEAEKLARNSFEIQLRSLGPRHPDTLNSLQQLGTALAYSHRYGEAAQLFRGIIDQGSAPEDQGDKFSAWYSFACVASAANRADESLRYLEEAINRGYKDPDGLMADDDFKSLRGNPKFQRLVAQLRQSPTPTAPH
jgi:eukaryotic-like serine/threonine-protein kinase